MLTFRQMAMFLVNCDTCYCSSQGAVGGAGSSWVLGKLLTQALFVAEPEGPNTDLKHSFYWAYSFLQPLIVAAER